MRASLWAMVVVSLTAGGSARATPPPAKIDLADTTGALIVDATRVYFTFVLGGPNEAGVFWLPKQWPPQPSGARSLWRESRDNPDIEGFRLAQDRDWIYAVGGHGVSRVPKAGGASQHVLAFPPGHHGSTGYAAVDEQYVYATDMLEHLVLRAPKAGGSPETIYSDPQRRFPGPIAVDARSLYWVDEKDGSLQRVPKAGGQPEVIGHGTGRCFGLVLDATHAYFTDHDGGRVLSVPLAGGETAAIAADQGSPFGVALDDTHVYFTDPARSTVMRVKKMGGPVDVVAAERHMPLDVAVDAHDVFFVEMGAMSLMGSWTPYGPARPGIVRVAKPQP